MVLTSEYLGAGSEIKRLTGYRFSDYARQMAEMRYEATRGIWRILKILGRRGTSSSTFFVNGATAQKYPNSVRAIAAQGHEVARTPRRRQPLFTMPAEKERRLIGRVIGRRSRKLQALIASGWLTPRAQISEHTIELIMKHGFTWHSDCFDDDLPYLAFKANGRALVEVPRSTLTDDYAMMGNLTARPSGSHRDMLAVWIDEFDVLYREADLSRLLCIEKLASMRCSAASHIQRC